MVFPGILAGNPLQAIKVLRVHLLGGTLEKAWKKMRMVAYLINDSYDSTCRRPCYPAENLHRGQNVVTSRKWEETRLVQILMVD